MVSAVANSPINPSFCSSPIQWISAKVRAAATAIFGYLLRIVTFQLGEMRVRGAYPIIRIYQRLSCDPREERPFDPNRLEESKNLLLSCGGVESTVSSADGPQIRCMTLRSADFFQRFHQLGSDPIDIIHEDRPRRALLNPPPMATKFYFPIIDIRMPDGTLQKGALLPESPPAAPSRPHILQCHSPGRSMCMDRKFLGLHLAAGYDVTIWDPRGTVDSTGTPSEGGYYLDADAVFAHVLRQGYPPNRIYVSGFCEGAAIASHLKQKYHHLGVHFIAGNPYTSMKDVVEGHGWLGRLAARYGLSALQSTDPQITSRVQQDYFSNVAKFRNLPRSEGRFIFLHTDPDTMMPRGTVQTLAEAIGRAGPVHEILCVHKDPKTNRHTKPPYEDPLTWRRYIQLVT